MVSREWKREKMISRDWKKATGGKECNGRRKGT